MIQNKWIFIGVIKRCIRARMNSAKIKKRFLGIGVQTPDRCYGLIKI